MSAMDHWATQSLLNTPYRPAIQDEEDEDYQGPTDDSCISPRSQSTGKIILRLLKCRVIYIRGPPMSGKTMLAHAISEHLKKKYPEFKVNSITWAPPPVPLYRNMDPWLSYLASFTEEPSKWLLQQDNLVYIIDEAEQSFKDKAFWNSCLRTASRHDHGPYFVLLSSYGSASDAIIDPLSAPPKIGLQWDQRITFSRVQLGSAVASLCFDEEEFEFLCRRLCEHLGQGIIMSSDLKDYIFELTDGHPGLTDTLVRALLQSRELHDIISNDDILTLQEARMLLDDDAWTFRCIGHRCSRALPSSEELGRNHTLRRLLEKAVVHRGIITENINQVAGLEQAYKAGYLISEMVDTDLVAYIFPTNLHERYIRNTLLSDAINTSVNTFTSVKDLCVAAIKTFSSTTILEFQNTVKISPGSIRRTFESPYQDELYLRLYEVLGNKITIRHEYSQDSINRVDFIVMDKGWAIECSGEGIRVLDHQERIEAGEEVDWRYKTISDYILLDFCEQHPTEASGIPHLYHVTFNSNGNICTMVDSNLKVVIPEFCINPDGDSINSEEC